MRVKMLSRFSSSEHPYFFLIKPLLEAIPLFVAVSLFFCRFCYTVLDDLRTFNLPISRHRFIFSPSR